MTTLLVILGSSFGICVFVTPLARALAARYGLVDWPDGKRKVHARATPRAGGIAILLSATVALSASLIASRSVRDQLAEEGLTWLGLLVAACVICLVGLVDDLRDLRVRHKLVGQLAAILIVISSGLLVRNISLFGWELQLGLLAVPCTVFWLLGAINSLNFIDGMDGLLSCVGGIITLAMAVMAALGEHWAAACVAVALLGALVGFLRYNLPPATIFLGDSGSMLIGLVLGALAIQSSLKGPATIALAAPLAVLTIPILDTTAAIARRKLTGRSLYATDRGHLHHCLLHRGFSSWGVLLCVSFLCLVTVAGALASLTLKNELFALLTALAVVAVLIATRLFGYAEFLLVKERLLSTTVSLFRLRTNGEARQVEVRLQGCADWRELWAKVTACAQKLNLQKAQLDVNVPLIQECYHARWERHSPGDAAGAWRAEIPLAVRGRTVGRLQIIGQRDHEPVWPKIATFAQVVQDCELAVSALPGVVLKARPPDPEPVILAARLEQVKAD
jgi:UDP-GlcNAc:undecaprenyl-phosphate GlcNAc-1-phosphate transferase